MLKLANFLHNTLLLTSIVLYSGVREKDQIRVIKNKNKINTQQWNNN